MREKGYRCSFVTDMILSAATSIESPSLPRSMMKAVSFAACQTDSDGRPLINSRRSYEWRRLCSLHNRWSPRETVVFDDLHYNLAFISRSLGRSGGLDRYTCTNPSGWHPDIRSMRAGRGGVGSFAIQKLNAKTLVSVPWKLTVARNRQVVRRLKLAL